MVAMFLTAVACGYLAKIISAVFWEAPDYWGVDMGHLVLGTSLMGITGFASIANVGAFHGIRFSSGSSNSSTSKIELVILVVLIAIGLIKCAFNIYNWLEHKVNRALENASEMVENIDSEGDRIQKNSSERH